MGRGQTGGWVSNKMIVIAYTGNAVQLLCPFHANPISQRSATNSINNDVFVSMSVFVSVFAFVFVFVFAFVFDFVLCFYLHYGIVVGQLLCPLRTNPIIQRSATTSISIIAQHHHPLHVVLCCMTS